MQSSHDVMWALLTHCMQDVQGTRVAAPELDSESSWASSDGEIRNLGYGAGGQVAGAGSPGRLFLHARPQRPPALRAQAQEAAARQLQQSGEHNRQTLSVDTRVFGAAVRASTRDAYPPWALVQAALPMMPVHPSAILRCRCCPSRAGCPHA